MNNQFGDRSESQAPSFNIWDWLLGGGGQWR